MRNIAVLRRIPTFLMALSLRRSHTYQRIADLWSSKVRSDSATVKGWVRSIRKMKDNVFVDIDDGSCAKRLQIVVGKSIAGEVDYGSSIEASGQLVEAPSGQLEMRADVIRLIGQGQLQDGYPFAPRKSYSPEYYRQYLHLRPRLAHYASLFRIRDTASILFRDFLRKHNYFEVHTPIITSNDSEGAGEVFNAVEEKTNVKGEKFFDTNVYLTVSAQLHLEIVARSLSQVYCFAPTFRAENSKSRFHLAEFYMLEAETTLVQTTEDLTKFVEEMLQNVISGIMSSNGEDVTKCREKFTETNTKLEEFLQIPWTIMSYEEASNILVKNNSKLKINHSPGDSLNKEHELFLTTHNGGIPIFLVDWPAHIKSFYMKCNKNKPNNVEAFDLLFPDVGEICGGSLREDNITRLSSCLNNHKGLDWYLDLRKYGNVLTGGFGLGFDRFLMSLLNITNIKDTVPFPRFPHHCLL